MDKKPNKIALAVLKIADKHRSDKTKLLKSVVSLVLASVILVTCTFCWYILKTANLSANNFSLDAGKGLRVNDTGTTQFSSDENDFQLIPASSVDGRNLFFPADGTDFSDVTKDMTFRSANAGDKNCNYIQIDFDLTAQANHTAIYINPEQTSLGVYNKEANENRNNASPQLAAPLRMAIWTSAVDNNDTTEAVQPPIVFNSLAKTVTSTAVNEVDRATGEYISAAPQVAHQFSDYAYGGTPIATLSAGVKTKFSVIVWLEGTDSKCKYTRITKRDIAIKLAFKTSWDNTEVIRFKDDTSNHWIRRKLLNDGYALTLRYTNPNVPTDILDFKMYKYPTQQISDENLTEWSASIPGDMKNKITFVLTPPSGGSQSTYTFCRSTANANNSTENRGVNRQYVVTLPADSTTSLCRGEWTALGDSDGGGVDIGDLEGDDF